MHLAKPSLSGQVLLGLVLGIATGVFFGEAAASVRIVGEANLVEFVNRWIDLKQRGGTIATPFQHWILGRATEEKQPRWSVIHDVLNWGGDRAADDAS